MKNNLPYSPDVAERLSADGGFSAGWGFHFHPSETYWFDCHNHLHADLLAAPDLRRALHDWFAALDAYRLGRVTVIVNDERAIEACGELAGADPRFSWLYRMAHDLPDPALMQRALDCGAVGLKLHNGALMSGASDPGLWLNQEWSRVFEVLARAKGAVLWHVVQRVGASPYHGGGANSYWEDAQGTMPTSNEKLLHMTLSIARRYPDIAIIGAHQMHIGLERLAGLFEQYPNLVIDTSCGFFVRWGDRLYPDDRDLLREFFMKYPERMLFGTDCTIAPDAPDSYKVQAFLGHVRFIRQLCLPDDVLQQVAHGNAERVLRLAAMTPAQRGNVRP